MGRPLTILVTRFKREGEGAKSVCTVCVSVRGPISSFKPPTVLSQVRTVGFYFCMPPARLDEPPLSRAKQEQEGERNQRYPTKRTEPGPSTRAPKSTRTNQANHSFPARHETIELLRPHCCMVLIQGRALVGFARMASIATRHRRVGFYPSGPSFALWAVRNPMTDTTR